MNNIETHFLRNIGSCVRVMMVSRYIRTITCDESDRNLLLEELVCTTHSNIETITYEEKYRYKTEEVKENETIKTKF